MRDALSESGCSRDQEQPCPDGDGPDGRRAHIRRGGLWRVLLAGSNLFESVDDRSKDHGHQLERTTLVFGLGLGPLLAIRKIIRHEVISLQCFTKESESAILALNYPPARFELLRQSRPDRRDGSCGGPNGHFRPVWRNGLANWPPGHPWPPFYSQVAHCYALVKNLHTGTAQGLPAAFPGRLNRN